MKRTIDDIRGDFPILNRECRGKPLVYLDNAATTQLPLCVAERIADYYAHSCANVHRGAHLLSEEATDQLERVRGQTARFLNAESEREIIFTSGATGGINLLAASLGRAGLAIGANIVVTEMEHHSNFVPWQQLCHDRGLAFRVVPITESGELDREALVRLVDENTALLALTAVSNVLGTVNPVGQIVSAAHAKGVPVLIDASQTTRAGRLDVRALNCDFLCFSAHKMLGPNGVGVLYGKEAMLEKLPPSAYGGGMIDSVTAGETRFAELPAKFEPGTPNISGILGFGASLDYLQELGIDEIAARERMLLDRAEDSLRAMDGIRVFGSPPERRGCLSFAVEGLHSFDTAALLDRLGIAVRAGHHCAQPLMDALGVSGTVRMSPAFYNTEEEIDRFCASLVRIAEMRRSL